jgi:hypothetical protein
MTSVVDAGALTLVPNLPAQLATFVMYICFRGFLYSVLTDFIAREPTSNLLPALLGHNELCAVCADTFGLATVGRIIGFVYVIAAIGEPLAAHRLADYLC